MMLPNVTSFFFSFHILDKWQHLKYAVSVIRASSAIIGFFDTKETWILIKLWNCKVLE